MLMTASAALVEGIKHTPSLVAEVNVVVPGVPTLLAHILKLIP